VGPGEAYEDRRGDHGSPQKYDDGHEAEHEKEQPCPYERVVVSAEQPTKDGSRRTCFDDGGRAVGPYSLAIEHR
jgi:hypothetical protein